MKKKRKSRTKKINPVFISLSLVLSIIFIILLALINILPAKYFLPIVVILVLINLIIFGITSIKKSRIFGYVLSVILSLVLLPVIAYEARTLFFMMKIKNNDFKTYNLVLLSNENLKSVKDIKNMNIGLLNDSEDLKEEVVKKTKANILMDSELNTIINNYNNKKVKGFIVLESYLNMLQEENDYSLNGYKVIDTFEVKVPLKITKNDKDVTDETFNILITGIDTRGKISSVARSDVNMVATINPKTHKMVLTSIPRDYYVTIKPGKMKDKLTHSGIYGIDTTIYAIENLLDIKIDYYLKLNFTSVVDIVDALDGVTVNSDANFSIVMGEYSDKVYTFTKGENKVDGMSALAFVRERKSFVDGDRRRGMHQQELVRAIIDKAISPKIITKYNSLLNSLDGSFDTNMELDEIRSIIKNQINNNVPYEITNVNLTGSDHYDYTYSYQSSKLYVMIPKEESVVNAKKIIKEMENSK